MDIKQFNQMYGLPVAKFPGTEALPNGDFRLRLRQLKKILQAEVDEIDEIIYIADAAGWITEEQTLVMLTMVADLMTDLQVYAQSEMVRWGLPIDEIHNIVMQSNASKLMEDGSAQVIDGKLQKGPNYWKPEPQIRALLALLRKAGQA